MKKICFMLLLIGIVGCCKPHIDTAVPTDTTVQVVDKLPVEEMDSIRNAIHLEDSIYYTRLQDSIIEYYDGMMKVRDEIYQNKYDSIKIINDSLNVELFRANYKLNKISQYNAIAAKGNNIKYLRGWIRRALEE